MAYENIDEGQIQDKGELLIQRILKYSSEEPDIKERLSIERELKGYFKLDRADAFLNFILESIKHATKD